MSVLELRSISRQYGHGASKVAALSGVNMNVEAGELVAVMGASGSGKTTLLTIAGTLEEPSTGEVFIDGVAVSTLSVDERAALRRIVARDGQELKLTKLARPWAPHLARGQVAAIDNLQRIDELWPEHIRPAAIIGQRRQRSQRR